MLTRHCSVRAHGVLPHSADMSRKHSRACGCAARSISSIASTLATLPNLQFVNLGYNMLDGELHRSCNLTSTKACSSEGPLMPQHRPHSSRMLHSMLKIH